MKKRLQVLFFLSGLSGLLFITQDHWEGWILGALSFIFIISVIFIGLIISLENRNPTITVSWLIVLGVFPVIGFIFYLLFGQNYRKKRMFQKKAWLDDQAFAKIEGNRPINDDKLNKLGEHQKQLFFLAHKIGKSPISFSTDTKVLTNGKETFSAIIDHLNKARHHIHLEYYIVRDDEIGREIKAILIKKARSGVKVRFLYDSVGSWKLPKSYIEELNQYGVEMVPFSPVRFPILNNKINFRNHRKIIIVDGNIGFMGGLNIGDEYLGKDPYFGFWRDTHLFVKGEAVRTLQVIFLQDWYYMTGKPLLTQNYLSPTLHNSDHSGGVQMLAGGPDNEWEVIKDVFFSMIISAKESIWIATPYFIPDEDILTALRVATLSGIDVRIIVPSRPDKRIVFHASRSYFPELLEAGTKVYEYEKGFLHSKVIIVDGQLASIGTSNMDMRSFHLNFEVNAFLYRTKSINKLVEDYIQDIEDSKQIDFEAFQQRSIFLRLLESMARLFSPLL